ncbi:MAG TPA: hypothetical protein VHL85_03415 [Burkholderiales bacterium]|jgi:hypothetical protein|nr:hypothetical protein [Burkholderiales bacterium]
MAEPEDDLEVSRRYRELGREEPPSALDARIVAEARCAAETHPASLVAPTGRRRWYFPVAAAAVIVLAVAVTVQLEREQRPDAEAAPPSAPAPELNKDSQTAARPAEPKAPAPAADMAEMRADRQEAGSAAGAPAARAPMQPRNLSSAESAARELERIARLRTEGKHDEADRALAEFRKRYPNYRIPQEMLKRVERR